MATKREVLIALDSFNFTNDVQVGEITVTPDDIKDFISKSIAQIDNKAAKAKEKQAEAKAAGDELRGRIEAVLSDTFQTIADIIDALDDDEVTPAKVTARMTQLVKLGKVIKEPTKTEDGRRIMAYKLAEVEDDLPFEN